MTTSTLSITQHIPYMLQYGISVVGSVASRVPWVQSEHSGFAIRSTGDRSTGDADTFLDDIGDPNLAVLKVIPVRFSWPHDDECLAEFVEAGLAISAETTEGAVAALTAQIADSYNLYTSGVGLGPELRRRREVLEEYIGKKRR